MLTDEQRKARLAGPSSKKVKFTKAEDAKLTLLVQQYSTKDWKKIAEHLPTRTARQCRERWTNYVNPSLSKSPWTKAEDMLLIEKHNEFGNHWKIIERYFPLRSKNNIKHRWSIVKEQILPKIAAAQQMQLQFQTQQAYLMSNYQQMQLASLRNMQNKTTKSNRGPKKPKFPLPMLEIPTSPSSDDLILSDYSPSNESDDVMEVNADPFQFFDRIIDQHEMYVNQMEKSDIWSFPEEGIF